MPETEAAPAAEAPPDQAAEQASVAEVFQPKPPTTKKDRVARAMETMKKAQAESDARGSSEDQPDAEPAETTEEPAETAAPDAEAPEATEGETAEAAPAEPTETKEKQPKAARALVQSEKQNRELKRQLRQMDEMRSRMDATDKRTVELDELKKTNPLKWMQENGLSFAEAARIATADPQPEEEPAAKELRELRELVDQQVAAGKEQAVAAKQQQATIQIDEAKIQVKTEIEAVDAETFPYLAAMKGQSAAYTEHAWTLMLDYHQKSGGDEVALSEVFSHIEGELAETSGLLAQAWIKQNPAAARDALQAQTSADAAPPKRDGAEPTAVTGTTTKPTLSQSNATAAASTGATRTKKQRMQAAVAHLRTRQ